MFLRLLEGMLLCPGEHRCVGVRLSSCLQPFWWTGMSCVYLCTAQTSPPFHELIHTHRPSITAGPRRVMVRASQPVTARPRLGPSWALARASRSGGSRERGVHAGSPSVAIPALPRDPPGTHRHGPTALRACISSLMSHLIFKCIFVERVLGSGVHRPASGF